MQLEQTGESPDNIQLNCETITTWFLLAVRLKIFNEPQQFDRPSHPTQKQLLQLWEKILTGNPELGVVYMDILLGCIDIDHNQLIERPGLGQVARAASLCLLRVLSGIDPTSTAVKHMCQKYIDIVSHHANFEALLWCHTISVIHILFIGKQEGLSFQWMDYKPCPQEHALFANSLVQVAHKAQEHQGKVPRWILRFVLHSLSLEPPPLTSVVIDCLSIIGIDLGCDISSTRAMTLDERYIHIYLVSTPLTQN